MDNIVSRDTMRACGAEAFYDGRGVDDHHMNWMSPAVADWKAGWYEAQAEQQQDRQWATERLAQALAGANPP
jgi:hypothetical protein